MSTPVRSHGGGIENRVSDLERKQRSDPFGDPAAVRTTLDVYSKAETSALAANNKAHAVYTSHSGSITTVTPLDDTIPQVSEGVQILSASITPRATTSTLFFSVTGQMAPTAGSGNLITAVFVNGAATSIRSSWTFSPSSGASVSVCLSGEHSPASTSAQTFTVRVGCTNAANPVALNGDSGRRLGGAQGWALNIWEVGSW